MKKTQRIKAAAILFCLLFGSWNWIQAQQADTGFQKVEDLEGLIDMINRNALNTETIKSSFVQQKHLSVLDEVIESKGSFCFKKDNNLRWAYEEPFEYAIILSGGKFTILDGSSISEYDIDSNETFMKINDLIIGMVQGKIAGKEEFSIRAFENSLYYRISLIPTEIQMKDVISEMEIFFSKKDLSVAKILMKENETDKTMITFIDNKINESIPDSVFSSQL